jgi:hypothetical protein
MDEGPLRRHIVGRHGTHLSLANTAITASVV